MSDHLECHRASNEEIEAVTSLITLAFANDPLWSWATARPDGDTSHQAALWRIFVEGALRFPWTWLTEGGEATSVWIPPGEVDMTDEQEERIAELARDVLGAGSTLYLELFDRFADAHPQAEPHYYLSLLGTHPAHRGQGIGMALLKANLEVIDSEGMPAYLESSNPGNNKRYASVGFESFGEVVTPDGGPVVTTMWRPRR